jgi:hypothetical protein
MPLHAVKYNVVQAVARRGRRIDDKRNVELALLACQRYGAAVLLPSYDRRPDPGQRGDLNGAKDIRKLRHGPGEPTR